MKKLNEFLTQILTPIMSEAESVAILSASALNQIDVPDDIESKFGAHFMTADRAANDPKVTKLLTPKIFGRLADSFESDLKQIVNAHLPDEWKTKYYAIPETQVNGVYDRLRVVKEGIAAVAEKGTGDDVKTLQEKHRKLEKELRDNIKALETTVTTVETNAAATVTREKLNYALRSKIEAIIPKLDPALFKTDFMKKSLVNGLITDLHAGYSLDFEKENPDAIAFLKKDGTDVYEGNTKVTLDAYLEKQVEPYTVKNGGGTPPPSNNGKEAKKIDTGNQGVMDAKARRLAAASM